MKKKVKKIPKYAIGTSGVNPYDLTTINNIVAEMNAKAASVQNNGISASTAGTIASGKEWGDMNKTQRTGAIIDAAAALGQGVNVATSGQDVNFGTALNTATSMATAGATIGGPVGAGIGFGVGAIMGTAGRSAGYDANSTSTNFNDIYEAGKGWLSWFDADNKARRMANMVQSSNIAKARTEDLKADYANQGNNPAPNILAAEGGIVPGEHYASRGEVEVAADGTNAVRYGWDPKGKDTYHIYTNPDGSSAVGNMVFTEEGVKRPNGEKYSDAAEKIIKGTKEGSKLRQISLRKLANEMEEQKMGKEIKKLKRGIPAHENGENPYAPSNMGNNTWWTYVKNLADQFGESVEQFLNRAKLRGEDLAKFGSTGLIPYVNPTTGTVSFALPWGSKYIDGSTRADDTIINEKVAAPVVKDGQTVVVPQVNEKTTNVVNKNVAKVSPKKDITKKEIPVKKLDKSVGVLKTPNLSKQYSSADTHNPNLVQLGKDPFKKLEEKLFEPVQPIESELTTSNHSNPGWQDWLYRTALLTQPWWDMAKAEPVKYTLPNAKYIPVGADPTPLMKSADETYSIGNYNFAQFGGSTGQRMGYGAALANNRAKQYADAYKWQQDVQNKQIAQNVGIYNNWDTQRTEILNNVYDKTAANRATARNINRQNRATALSNWGTMLSDDKKMNLETQNNRLKAKILKPLIESVYENSDELIPMLAPYTMNRNVKKKSPTR